MGFCGSVVSPGWPEWQGSTGVFVGNPSEKPPFCPGWVSGIETRTVGAERAEIRWLVGFVRISFISAPDARSASEIKGGLTGLDAFHESEDSCPKHARTSPSRAFFPFPFAPDRMRLPPFTRLNITQNHRRLLGGLDRSERDMPRRGEARWGRAESTGKDAAAGTMRPDR
jgi:hypothetical protein